MDTSYLPPERVAQFMKEGVGGKKEENKKIQINLSGMLGTIDIDEWSALKLCNELLSKIAESDIIDELKSYPYSAGGNERDLLKDSMVKILKEKYGLLVKKRKVKEAEKISPMPPTGAW